MILKVSPNPSLDNILVKNVSVLDDHFTVDVYDYLGQKVFTAKAQKDKNLNIENLIPGFYMLKVIESNQTIKFIKQ